MLFSRLDILHLRYHDFDAEGRDYFDLKQRRNGAFPSEHEDNCYV